ncbi:hepatic and glial cell adhesion molecule-like isoform X2 [Stegostoma tigrinum]|uniref:hepatic and glial cell adhesion molecule-like isoform X2 n=1 Tax=Stegostoma tigrinum TaxID=3053191 RepID=UPI0028704525|nr:hepatic and glial cell adhesion molecule-like isoform X2 [Stegostoma tigrinum]
MEGFGFSLRLLQFLACSASAQHVKDSIVAITGSSVLLPGTDKGFGSLQWEFSKPGKILPILDYIGGHQQAYDQYKNRIELNKSDGTLLLKDVREGDTGRYKMTVDLDPIRTRIVTLRVFDPLSRPTVFCNGSLDGSPVLLICTVERGRADTIHWSRGDFRLLHDERYRMSKDNSTVIIQSAQESDSGNYTCTVENPVSQSKNSCQLFFKSQRPRVRLGLHMAGVLLCLVIVALSIFFAWKTRESATFTETQ